MRNITNKLYKMIIGGVLTVVLWIPLACDIWIDDLGDGYSINYDDYGIILNRSSTPYIPVLEELKDIRYDDRYIIAIQDINRARYFLEKRRHDEYESYFNSITSFNDSCGYWLIDRSLKLNYGPLDSISFYNLCDSLQVKVSFNSNLVKSLFKLLLPDKISISK